VKRRRLRRRPATDRLMRWAALPITDRRWAAPLSAVALGFGLFVGVAIGPGAAGTFATGATQVIEIPSFGGTTSSQREEKQGGEAPSGGEGVDTQPAPPTVESLLAEEPHPTFTPLEGGESRTRAPAPADKGDAPPESGQQEGEPEAPLLAGTVVHVNSAAGSYTVAEAGGVMSAVHAGKLPAPGTKVEVPIETLANGTLAEAGKRKKSDETDSASLAGIVTFVDASPAAPAYTVSNRGVSLLVHVHPDPSGAAPALPALGTYATVKVDVASVPPAAPAAPTGSEPAPASSTTPGVPAATPSPAPSACAPNPAQPSPPPVQPRGVLWQRQASAGGAPFAHGDFEGIVAAICAETGQLLISADDIREGGHDLLLTVPPAIDLAKIEVGESVAAAADIGADGSLALTGLASDEHGKGADDEGATQGDLVPAKSGGEASQ
jgi:hypothetical protein